MSASYREYLELFEYFGRGGMTVLSRRDFEALEAEFDELLARDRPLPREAVQRVAELKALLFRDRPRLKDLVTTGRR